MLTNRSAIFLFGFFTLLFLFGLIYLLVDARQVDAALNGKVLVTSDDHEYQRLAVNLRHGQGYNESLVLPLDDYMLDMSSSEFAVNLEQQYSEHGSVITSPVANFYRAPGYPMLLSVIYTFFGDSTLAARSATAVMIWFVAMLLLATGAIWDAERGIFAAGVVGIIYMLPSVIRIWGLDSLMTEVPTTFWVMVFGFFFVLHQKTGQMRYFVSLAVAMVALIYTRANFLLLLPLFAVYFFFAHYGWRKVLIFAVIVAVPVAFWSAYASAGVGKFVSFTTQGELAFPQYNNMDVITGVGPDRIFQGNWNPGYHIDSQGIIRDDDRFVPKAGENGWVMGLTFWRENPTLIPALFYVKLRAGFWTREELVGIYTMGLCFLLMAPGFRASRRPPRLLPQVSAWNILKIQIGLSLGATLAMIFVGAPVYWLVLIAYAIIFALALLRPYGNVYHSSVASPVWFLLFVGSHLITTLLYMGIRFHEPMDPLLCMYGIYGAIIFAEALVFPSRRHGRALVPEMQVR